MENTTYKIENNQIVETTTTEKEYDPNNLISDLEYEKEQLIFGRDKYVNDINSKLELINSKLELINNLLK